MKSLRYQLYQSLELAKTRLGKLVNFMLLLLILVNVMAIVLESVDSLGNEYKTLFFTIEMVSILIFTVEYIT